MTSLSGNINKQLERFKPPSREKLERTVRGVVEIAQKPVDVVTGSTSKSSKKYTAGFWALLMTLTAIVAFWRMGFKKKS